MSELTLETIPENTRQQRKGVAASNATTPSGFRAIKRFGETGNWTATQSLPFHTTFDAYGGQLASSWAWVTVTMTTPN